MVTATPRSQRIDRWLFAIREVFVVSLLSYVVFALLDDVIDGSISDYISMPAVLAVVLISGVVTFLVEPDRQT